MRTNKKVTKEKFKGILQKIRLITYTFSDANRFSKNASFHLYKKNAKQLEARIIYNVHAIEKGLSRGSNFRPGFGKKALSDLNDSMVQYHRMGNSVDSFAYIQGLSIISKYIEVHQKLSIDISKSLELIDSHLLEFSPSSKISGTKEILKYDKVNNKNINFEMLALNRYSVRDFSSNPISNERINSVLAIASKTPSVCNRQGWNTRVISNPGLIDELLRLQRGFKGYETRPYSVVVVSVSNRSFLSPVERNQAFIDGGLYSMSLLYAFEYECIAAVPLNAMMNHSDNKSIRNLINIDDSEEIIMFIAIGEFMDKTIVPISARKSVADTNIFITELVPK